MVLKLFLYKSRVIPDKYFVCYFTLEYSAIFGNFFVWNVCLFDLNYNKKIKKSIYNNYNGVITKSNQ